MFYLLWIGLLLLIISQDFYNEGRKTKNVAFFVIWLITMVGSAALLTLFVDGIPK